ncbi:nucleoside triphosphate pyrophosphohydrolase [Novosphingobium mangrovi (ex Hu et al. 2023)]|uniref:Nucleoside triphosphate pyrophosphohydrolase n=1 Tax=Novosphingobium mangrovi (ex Hu et al. 2023) TaxID=2930094 RepID=A0ABT0AF99_9SPHN|nr:nucleoside triphosphate pyrophosphohydrolase [Novosphingobium mangrovi (ex Hu et al. 2023)]MCJ1961878.1 nucleoside triphosphate pyrophosphohydrolase [Novosphingobium mangrovi (ex Hu et al. 2023)]
MTAASRHDQIDRLLSIMATLRDPVNGCEWDRAQDFASIAPYTIEEAYEVADAIERADLPALREELGDLLLQVVFHARMAEEQDAFAFADVAAAISNKLEARHPHIFGEGDTETGQTERWEKLKAQERAAKGETSAVDGVAGALPALMRAEKLQKRAARVGFDWPDPSGAEDKVREELVELAEASDAEKLEEAGDLLFAAVNLVRLNGIAPEDALRAANAKFERRFRGMEALASQRDEVFADLDLDAQEALWQAVKASERAKTA